MEEKIQAVAFTGHRELEADFDEKRLKKVIKTLIKQGARIFYSGMARGFDLIAAEIVAKEKKKNQEIRLIACIPCPKQERAYSDTEKVLYERLLVECDEKVIVSDHYFRGCMQVRNKYMETRADALIAYCHKEEGGSAYTKKLFEKKGKPVFLV